MVPVYSIDSEEGIERAVAALRGGEIIAFPTDTLYGVGGNALSHAAAERVVAAKGREPGRGLPVLLAARDDAHQLAAAWPAAAAQLAERYWPGALTIVVPARPEVPKAVRAERTVALRVPGLAALRRLIERAGVPLIGTSANRSGEPPAVAAAQASQALGHAVSLVLDGGRVGGAPSTVVRVDGDALTVLREGAIPASDVLARLG